MGHFQVFSIDLQLYDKVIVIRGRGISYSILFYYTQFVIQLWKIRCFLGFIKTPKWVSRGAPVESLSLMEIKCCPFEWVSGELKASQQLRAMCPGPELDGLQWAVARRYDTLVQIWTCFIKKKNPSLAVACVLILATNGMARWGDFVGLVWRIFGYGFGRLFYFAICIVLYWFIYWFILF